jgi:hypothetical protein
LIQKQSLEHQGITINDVASPWNGKTLQQIRQESLGQNGLYQKYQKLLQKISTLQSHQERSTDENKQIACGLQEVSALHEVFATLRIREYKPGFLGLMKAVFLNIFISDVSIFRCKFVKNEYLKTIKKKNEGIQCAVREVFKLYSKPLDLQQNEENRWLFTYAVPGTVGERDEISMVEGMVSEVFFTLDDLLKKQQIEEEKIAPEKLFVENDQTAKALISQYGLVSKENAQDLIFLVKKTAATEAGGERAPTQYVFSSGEEYSSIPLSVRGKAEKMELVREARVSKGLYERAFLFREKGIPAEAYAFPPTKEIKGTFWIEPQGEIQKLCIRTAGNELKQYHLLVKNEGVELIPFNFHGETIKKPTFQEFMQPNEILADITSLRQKINQIEAEKIQEQENNRKTLQGYHRRHESLSIPISSVEARKLVVDFGGVTSEVASTLVFLAKGKGPSVLGKVFGSRNENYIFQTPKGSKPMSEIATDEEEIALYQAAERSKKLYEVAQQKINQKQEDNRKALQGYQQRYESLCIPISSVDARKLVVDFCTLTSKASERLVFLEKGKASSVLGKVIPRWNKNYIFQTPEGPKPMSEIATDEEKITLYQAAERSKKLYEEAQKSKRQINELEAQLAEPVFHASTPSEIKETRLSRIYSLFDRFHQNEGSPFVEVVKRMNEDYDMVGLLTEKVDRSVNFWQLHWLLTNPVDQTAPDKNARQLHVRQLLKGLKEEIREEFFQYLDKEEVLLPVDPNMKRAVKSFLHDHAVFEESPPSRFQHLWQKYQ